MKLSDNTLSILKNFATINPSILIKPGSVLKTMELGGTIFGVASIKEAFEQSIGIHNLPRFLNTLSLFSEPEIEFRDRFMVINDKNTSVRYNYSNPELIKNKTGNVNMGDVLEEFELQKNDLVSIMNSCDVLGLNHLAFVANGETITLKAVSYPHTTDDFYSIKLGETENEFVVFLKKDNIRVIKSDYTIQLNNNVVKFVGDNVEYYVSAEVINPNELAIGEDE